MTTEGVGLLTAEFDFIPGRRQAYVHEGRGNIVTIKLLRSSYSPLDDALLLRRRRPHTHTAPEAIFQAVILKAQSTTRRERENNEKAGDGRRRCAP